MENIKVKVSVEGARLIAANWKDYIAALDKALSIWFY